MNFVKISEKRAINLANVVQMTETEYDGRQCVRIDFIGGEYERIYSGAPGFYELQEWISEQNWLLHD